MNLLFKKTTKFSSTDIRSYINSIYLFKDFWNLCKLLKIYNSIIRKYIDLILLRLSDSWRGVYNSLFLENFMKCCEFKSDYYRIFLFFCFFFAPFEENWIKDNLCFLLNFLKEAKNLENAEKIRKILDFGGEIFNILKKGEITEPINSEFMIFFKTFLKIFSDFFVIFEVTLKEMGIFGDKKKKIINKFKISYDNLINIKILQTY